ncbi:MAG: outer membrane protein assembly factor BamA [Verrucomicrobiaceae bacterium]
MMYGPLSFSRLTLFVAAAFSLLIAAPGQLQAQLGVPQVPTEKKVVKDVKIVFKGPVKVDENRVRSQMSTRVGQPFSDEKVERDIRAIIATGTVENVEFRTLDVPGGVQVIVELIGRGGIADLGFVGNTAISTDRLRKEIEVKVGDPVDDLKLSAAQNKITELYEKKGYSDVAVTYDIAPSVHEGFSSVVFKIDEGARGIIHDIRFEGNTAISARKLRMKLKSREHHFWNVWGKTGKVSNLDLQEDIKIVERAFQDEGYVYAKVLEVRREPVSAKAVDIVFVIQEGSKYDVAGVTINGNTIFTTDALMPGIQTESGFPYVGSYVTADEKMIQDYYGSRGYADARVETSILDAGPGLVTVAYHITEGTKSYINKVNISGNDATEDQVIRRELPFAPGEELDTVKVAAGKSRLENLNYFTSVDVRNNPSGVEGYKDVDVHVTEQTTGTVNFGAGFSSIDSLTGFVSVTQTNFDIRDWKDFRGAGQRFNATAQVGNLRRNASVSWTEPWFMGRELALTVSAFYQNLYYLSSKYNQSSAGLSVGLRKRTGEHSYIEGVYTFQQVEIGDIDPSATVLIAQEAGTYLESKIDVNWVHDTRDNVFLTRRGHKVEAGATAAGLGGDVQIYGVGFSGQQYFSLWGDSILSFEGALRTVDNWGGSRVPIFERLFLGGANNLRGFNYRKAGPKDITGEPIGGLTSVYATAEYTVPVNILGAPPDKAPRVAFFGDIGTVGSSALNFGGTVFSDVGIGLRLFLPIGPIRVDYAVPVSKDQFTGSGRFQFNMGYKF